MLDQALRQCESSPSYWKWVIISLHSALQGAMVCHLSDTAKLGALTPKSQKNWLEWYDGGRKGTEPEGFLASPTELIKRVKGRKSGSSLLGAKIVSISEDQEFDFNTLHDFRNGFVHLQPVHWLIEISGMPRIVRSQLKIIEDIDRAGWAFRHLEDAKSAELKNLLSKVRHAPALEKIDENN